MLLNRIAMFLLMIMVFLTGFPHCLRLDIPSFLSLISHILSDSDNSNNNNSDSGNSNNNNSDSGNSNNNNSGSSGNSNNNNSDSGNSNNNNSDSGNSNNNNSDSGNSNNNNSGSSGNTFTPAIGVLDTSFNSPNGFIIQPIGSANDTGQSLAIQPDGKILLGGYCRSASNDDFCIARFNSDGTLDTTFGTNGKVIQPIGSFHDWGYSLAIQPDGKILLGGSYSKTTNNTNLWEFSIARFNSDGISDGTLDTSFGDSGKVKQGICITRGNQTTQTHATGQSLAIQPDRKILLGGRCQIINGFNEFCIARFNPNGTLDTDFGSPNGYIVQSLYPSEDWGYSLAIQTDGKILLGGSCINVNNANRYEFCIARFKTNGSLDNSFGNSGRVIQAFGSGSGYDWGRSLVIQRDGKILLGGHCHNGSNFDFCIARFNPNGTLDTTFGTGGKVILDINTSDDKGYSLAIQPDEKILLGGTCDGDFCIARFNSNGTLDTSFGDNGIVIRPIGSGDDHGYSLAIQPDGKILLGGYCHNGSNYDFCIARFK